MANTRIMGRTAKFIASDYGDKMLDKVSFRSKLPNWRWELQGRWHFKIKEQQNNKAMMVVKHDIFTIKPQSNPTIDKEGRCKKITFLGWYIEI